MLSEDSLLHTHPGTTHSNALWITKIDSTQRLEEGTVGGPEEQVNGSEAEGKGVPSEGQKIMPGVLKRTDDRSEPDLNGTAADEHTGFMAEEGPGKRKGTNAVNGDAHQNGVVASTNGVYANGDGADSAMSPENLTSVVGTIAGQLPPEILHITEGYLPLSRLITRLAQDTFNGLNELINEMADMQPAQNNALPYMNGVGVSQVSQINVQKKTRLWDFAQDRRAKFIKILVLSQWSRQADLVGKVIDLNCWLRTQKDIYKLAVDWVGELKRQMGPMKLPSPDLKTALEALSTGKAGWLPDVSPNHVRLRRNSATDVSTA